MKGYDIALLYLGKEEIKDRTILQAFMAKHKIYIDPATTPWCAAFINACERAAGNPGNGMLNARSFITYGHDTTGNPSQGDIAVLKRGNSPWQGHVAYFDSFVDKNTIKLLGGNQNDKVCFSNYPLSKVICFRSYR